MTDVNISKYIFEIRYEAVPQAFDRRGEILEKVWRPFENKLKFWNVENVGITMHESERLNKKIIHVDHMRSYIAYESPDSFNEFSDDAKRFVKYLATALPEIKKVIRAGFRHVSFRGNEAPIEVFNQKVAKNWLAPKLPTTLDIYDSAVIVEHKNGRIVVGSSKSSDGFIGKEFPNEKIQGMENVNGNYIDIDSYIRDIEFSKGENMPGIVSSLIDVGATTYTEISKSIGW